MYKNKTSINVYLQILKFVNIILCVTLYFFTSSHSIAQSNPKPITSPCYCVEEGGSQPNTLFKLSNYNWSTIGSIYSIDGINLPGKIEAIAAKPGTNMLYAVDKNIFGTINTSNAGFSVVGYVANQKVGFGEFDNQLFDDIDAMSYDPYNDVIWAINRNPGNGPGTEDFLIQIDPNTGHFIPGVFENGYDYAVISSVYDGTLGQEVYDVDGISYNPYTDLLYAVQNQEGPGVITIINPYDGGVESVIYDMGEDDIEGLGISTYGELFGTSGDNGTAESSFIFIDVFGGQTTSLNQIDPTGEFVDFESFDCQIGLFDLAMKITLLTNSGNVKLNNNITLRFTIVNQGDVEVDKYILSAYLPTGLSLNDNTWSTGPNIKNIKRTINSTINPGETKTFNLTLKISNSAPASITLSAEISEFYNFTIDDVHYQSISLPDIDSTPDYINNETNIEDNVINKGGLSANADEDDHDIVNLTVIDGADCQDNLNVTGSIGNSNYTADENLTSNGTIINTPVEFNAGDEITLMNGFTVNSNTTFEASIQGCP